MKPTELKLIQDTWLGCFVLPAACASGHAAAVMVAAASQGPSPPPQQQQQQQCSWHTEHTLKQWH
jgi:hypothetical protein